MTGTFELALCVLGKIFRRLAIGVSGSAGQVQFGYRQTKVLFVAGS